MYDRDALLSPFQEVGKYRAEIENRWQMHFKGCRTQECAHSVSSPNLGPQFPMSIVGVPSCRSAVVPGASDYLSIAHHL